MRRRQFVSALLGASTVSAVGGATALDRQVSGIETRTQEGQIGQLLFPSTSGLLDANGDPLTDDSRVAVFAEPTAEVRDRDGNGDATFYPDDVDIPVVGVDEVGDGTVVGVGAPFVNDGDLVPELAEDDPLGDLGNEEFLLNVYDEYAGGATVLWDESHGQFYSLDRYRNFEVYAEDNGYDLQATTDLAGDLDGADALVVTSPSDAFTDTELDAVSNFVEGGGLLVLHDQSDFSDFDQTANSNDVAAAVGADFRFNDGEVGDTESNVGIYYLPLTTNFNDDFPLFGDRPGIVVDIQTGREYDVEVVDVADGDTFDVVFDGGDIGLETDFEATVRVLGIDTPESASVAAFAERPEEWEGLAYDAGAVDPVDELVFDSTASLLDANGDPLTDDSLVTVATESTATNADSDGNGDAVSYPEDADIPLVALDGTVAGIGAPFVDGGGEDSFDTTADNEEFVLNLYDEIVDGDTVLWDESHDQFYSLDGFQAFEEYAENEGYTLEPTTDLPADLPTTDAVVITSPSSEFTDAELDALADFVADGGAVVLHSQSDFNDFDQTANLNAITEALGVGFRFNDDQVEDGDNNGGSFFQPATGNFRGPDSLFAQREGIDDDPDARTTGYLTERASLATDFAVDALDGERVTLFFDENEPLRDPTRYLAYARYDADGDGSRDTLYNLQTIEEGYARAYGSTHSRHDDFWDAERDARDADRGVWTESDVAEASPYREQPLDELFFPEAASVRLADGRATGDVTAVRAESTAQEDGDGLFYGGGAPLFGVDEDNATALSGALIIDEGYEQLEGFDVDTSGYANFAFLSAVIDYLTDEDGPVYIDGGHGQFGADYALSNEDAAYYQRHLEGRGTNFEQINDVTRDRLSEAKALVVTTPVSAFSDAERDAVRSFRDTGGAVVLLGTAAAPETARDNLNDLAAGLDTDLRLNDVQVTDPENNVGDDPAIPTTSRVQSGPLLASQFDDGDGQIQSEEVLETISNYNSDDSNVTVRDVLEVISRFNGDGSWPGFGD